jgi:Raf kinase inhibitor-like YbhB/YbcL family protein
MLIIYLFLMKKNVFITTGMILAVALLAACAQQPPIIPITDKNMKLSSSVFNQNDVIPAKYTCDGEDISPPLTISDVPATTKSLALIVDDPDASAGDWVHWIVWNIKPETAEIAEKTVPRGATEGYTDFGKPGWGGPCPPSGVHHYQFKLYALDKVLDLPVTARKTDLEKALNGHTVDSTVLVGLYSRK